jgi:hypothetical protein
MTAPASDRTQEDHSRINYERTTEPSLQVGDADHEYQPWFR